MTYKREWMTPKKIIDDLREKMRMPRDAAEDNMEYQKCRRCGSEDFQVKIVIDKVSRKVKKEESKLCCTKCGEPVTAIGGEIVQ